METKTKVKALDATLLVLTFIASVVLWWNVDNIALKDSFYSWVVLFCSLLGWFVVFVISVVVIEKRIVVMSTMLGSFLMSLIFSPSLFQFIIVAIATGVCFAVHFLVTEEKKMLIPMEIWRIARPARIFLVLMITLIISGQFYSNVISSGIENLIPEIGLGKTERRIASNVIAMFDSSFSADELEEMTVDEFVLKKIHSSQENDSLFSDDAIKSRLDSIVLEEGRSGFSKMVNREISGSENIFDIFSEVINNKMNDFFKTNVESDYVAFVPWTIFVMLFVMTFSIISFLRPLMLFATKIIFAILLKIKVVQIEKVTVEKEVIVQYGGR